MTGTQKFVLGLASLFVVFCLGCMGCVTLGSLASKDQPPAVASAPTTTAPVPSPTASAPAPTRLPPTATLPPPPPTQTPLLPPPPTAPPAPAPPKPTSPPPPPPAPAPGSDLAALVAYAQAMKPILDEADVIVKRDTAILEASEDGNDAVLCDGRLAADVAPMKALVRRARRIDPPSEAAAIHRLVVESGESWTKALEHVDDFCRTGNGLYKAGAAIEFGKAALQLRDAATRFYWLAVAKGIEEWVQ